MHLLSNAVRSAALAALTLSLIGGVASRQQQDRGRARRPTPLFRAMGAGGGRRKEGF